nr:collagen alpha-1(I) chain-like [Equus asinus]
MPVCTVCTPRAEGQGVAGKQPAGAAGASARPERGAARRRPRTRDPPRRLGRPGVRGPGRDDAAPARAPPPSPARAGRAAGAPKAGGEAGERPRLWNALPIPPRRARGRFPGSEGSPGPERKSPGPGARSGWAAGAPPAPRGPPRAGGPRLPRRRARAPLLTLGSRPGKVFRRAPRGSEPSARESRRRPGPAAPALQQRHRAGAGGAARPPATRAGSASARAAAAARLLLRRRRRRRAPPPGGATSARPAAAAAQAAPGRVRSAPERLARPRPCGLLGRRCRRLPGGARDVGPAVPEPPRPPAAGASPGPAARAAAPRRSELELGALRLGPGASRGACKLSPGLVLGELALCSPLPHSLAGVWARPG